jgi:hypothetical protein
MRTIDAHFHIWRQADLALVGQCSRASSVPTGDPPHYPMSVSRERRQGVEGGLCAANWPSDKAEAT